MKITESELQQMINAFGEGWRREDARNDRQQTVQRGSRRRAGLLSALGVLGIQVEVEQS